MIENEQFGATLDSRYTPVEPRAMQVATITSEQIRAARGLLNWDRNDLAKASGLAVITIKTIEQRPGPLMVRTSTLYALQGAFEKAGIKFIDADNGGCGVRFKQGRK